MTMSDDDSKQIAELKAEVDKLKAAMTSAPDDPQAAARWADEMHQLREGRMSAASAFSRADLAAMEAACPGDTARAIAMRDNRAPTTPTSAIPGGQQIGRVSSSPGLPGSNTSGWAREIPLSPPNGIGYVDRLLEVDSARQRGERMVQDVRLKAAETK